MTARYSTLKNPVAEAQKAIEKAQLQSEYCNAILQILQDSKILSQLTPHIVTTISVLESLEYDNLQAIQQAQTRMEALSSQELDAFIGAMNTFIFDVYCFASERKEDYLIEKVRLIQSKSEFVTLDKDTEHA